MSLSDVNFVGKSYNVVNLCFFWQGIGDWKRKKRFLCLCEIEEKVLFVYLSRTLAHSRFALGSYSKAIRWQMIHAKNSFIMVGGRFFHSLSHFERKRVDGCSSRAVILMPITSSPLFGAPPFSKNSLSPHGNNYLFFQVPF